MERLVITALFVFGAIALSGAATTMPSSPAEARAWGGLPGRPETCTIALNAAFDKSLAQHHNLARDRDAGRGAFVAQHESQVIGHQDPTTERPYRGRSILATSPTFSLRRGFSRPTPERVFVVDLRSTVEFPGTSASPREILSASKPFVRQIFQS